MKKLVTAKTIEDFAAGKEKLFPIDENTLITPSARDVARSKGITFCCECDEAVEVKPEAEDVKADSLSAETKSAETNDEECSAKEKQEASECAESCKDSFDKEAVIEAVIKALDKRGVLDEILD